MSSVFIGLGVGFGIGSTISYLISFILKRQRIKEKEQEAQHIIQKAKNNEEHLREQTLNKVENYKLFLTQKQNHYLEKLNQTNHQLQIEIEQHTDAPLIQIEENKKSILLSVEKLSQSNSQKKIQLKIIKEQLHQIKTKIIQTLEQKFTINIENLKLELQKNWIYQARNQLLQQIKETKERFEHTVNQQAHFILDCAINRFQYPYCAERGIKVVSFPSEKAMKTLLKPDCSIIKIIEQECGVDMRINDQKSNISILGIDPVRRELGRASLQKIVKKNRIQKQDIQNIVKEEKKNLFRQIKIDGQKICQELNLTNVTTEIKNMMGSLRYRYSFAQNQYFHCQEVSWLCGLLSLEMGEPMLLARRAGMFHDIGKAMDHSKEGGHAVIGAEFIKKHGEQKEIVHAVQAHHHDITPEHPLDFLVISADAISGARPGARRSTVDSYNQKVLTLEKIGKNFKGVKDTYIMNAGKEIRVVVDTKIYNDAKTLKLSKQIASKIEEECSYPGLIKVTVLRTVIKNTNIQKNKTK